MVHQVNSMQRFSPSILKDAIDRKIILDLEYPVIYNQIMRLFESAGIQFYGDVDENYDIFLNQLEKELLTWVVWYTEN